MKWKLCICLLIFGTNQFLSQHKNIDSLERLIKVITDEGEKTKAFYAAARASFNINYQKALAYAVNAAQSARKVNSPNDLAKAYTAESFARINLGENDKAMAGLDSALFYYQKNNNNEGLANVYEYMGILYYNLGNYNKSLEYNLKSLKLFEDLKNKTGIAECLINIANINLVQNEILKAENNYRQAYDTYHSDKNKNGEALALTGMAHVLRRQDKMDLAIAQYARCIVLFDSLGNKEGAGSAYLGTGRILRLQNRNDEAFVAFEKALVLFESVGQANKSVETMGAIADVYMENRDFEKAIGYNEKFLKKAGEMRAKPYQRDAMEGLARSHAALGNFARAYGYQLLTSRIKDTLYSEERSARMTDMEVKYETEKKEQANKLLELELSRKNNLLIGSLVLAILALLFAYLFARQNRLAAKQKTIELEQKVLRSQMNPHFIFNSLIAIQSFIYRNDPKTSGDYLSDFAKLMRLILVNSREEFIPLNKEIETLKLYLRLQQLRFDNQFDFTIEADENIDGEEMAIPPMLAQPFIENAIEHGISRIERQGKIDVRFGIEGDLLKILVTDNGIGITKAMEQKEKSGHRSLATTITEERLSILNKGARKKISLTIVEIKAPDGTVSGTKIEFGVPFRKV